MVENPPTIVLSIDNNEIVMRRIETFSCVAANCIQKVFSFWVTYFSFGCMLSFSHSEQLNHNKFYIHHNTIVNGFVVVVTGLAEKQKLCVLT